MQDTKLRVGEKHNVNKYRIQNYVYRDNRFFQLILLHDPKTTT
jgi:hypothetical protein